MADRYWVGGAGTWDATDTSHWSDMSGGAAGFSAPTSADNVIFDSASNATAYAVTVGTNAAGLDVSISGPATGNVAVTSAATSVINVYGSWLNAATGVTFSSTTGAIVNFLATTTGKTVNTNNVTLGNMSVTFNGTGGEWTLGSAFTITTVSLRAGTFNLNGHTLTAVAFTGFNTLGTARTLTQGSSIINITGGAGSVWNTTAPAGLSYTTTPNVNFTYAGSGPRIIATADGLAYNGINANITAGTGAVTQSGAVNNLNFTGFSGSLSNSVRTIYGNLTLSVGMTVTVGTSVTTFDRAGTQTITSNGRAVNFPATFLGVGTTNCLDALALGTRQLIFAGGTLNLAAGTTSTVGSFVTFGTSMKFLGSTTPGTQATISDTGGTNFVTYLTIQDSAATGGAVWNVVSATNVDAGNNTGWRFVPDVTVLATGVQAIGYIGTLGATGTAFVYPSGVVGYGQIGYPLIWGLVDDTQTPNWNLISTPQTPNWQQIAA